MYTDIIGLMTGQQLSEPSNPGLHDTIGNMPSAIFRRLVLDILWGVHCSHM